MDISMRAKVYCQNKICGHTQAVILNPVSEVITHVVVKESKAPHTQRLVPVDMIDASQKGNIHLNCDAMILQNLPPFFDVEYIQTTLPHFVRLYDMTYFEPIVTPEKKFFPERIYHIPKGELAVKRGADVYSANGHALGKVDEFLVDESGHHVTHLILREGHILGEKDIFIPVAEIEFINESSLQLKLDKENIEKLPAIPVNRIWP